MSNDVINIDPEIMSGTPVFMGTRVPVRALTDHLEEGYSLEYFVDHFPTVSLEQAVRLIELAREKLPVAQEMSDDVINRDPEIMGGEPVFMGTRVPVSILMDYLIYSRSLDNFVSHFPAVSLEQAVRLIKLAREKLTVAQEMSNDVINRDPEIMGGEPVFIGTQVPVGILMDNLEAGGDLGEFLKQHPSVNDTQAYRLIRLAEEILTIDA